MIGRPSWQKKEACTLFKLSFSASAPGSMMLLGEHAVLHGYSALVAAVNYRMHVRLSLRKDGQVVIDSALGQFESPLKNMSIQAPFTFVLTAIDYYKDALSGVDLSIQSDFSHQVGLGSSAAVTVAVVAAMRKALGLDLSLNAIFHDAYEVVSLVQGVGSGADVAASVFGGLGCYRMAPFYYKHLKNIPRVFLYYSGSKMPTVEVIKHVESTFENRKDELAAIYKGIDACVTAAKTAIDFSDWRHLGKLFAQQQNLMDQLGVNNDALQSLVDVLSRQKKVKGVKISGSGLGDCVIALGRLQKASSLQSDRYIPVEIVKQGVVINE
jgi:mevalonate kinase